MSMLCWLKSWIHYAVLIVSVVGIAYFSVFGLGTGGIREINPTQANYGLEPHILFVSGALA